MEKCLVRDKEGRTKRREGRRKKEKEPGRDEREKRREREIFIHIRKETDYLQR